MGSINGAAEDIELEHEGVEEGEIIREGGEADQSNIELGHGSLTEQPKDDPPPAPEKKLIMIISKAHTSTRSPLVTSVEKTPSIPSTDTFSNLGHIPMEFGSFDIGNINIVSSIHIEKDIIPTSAGEVTPMSKAPAHGPLGGYENCMLI